MVFFFDVILLYQLMIEKKFLFCRKNYVPKAGKSILPEVTLENILSPFAIGYIDVGDGNVSRCF